MLPVRCFRHPPFAPVNCKFERTVIGPSSQRNRLALQALKESSGKGRPPPGGRKPTPGAPSKAARGPGSRGRRTSTPPVSSSRPAAVRRAASTPSVSSLVGSESSSSGDDEGSTSEAPDSDDDGSGGGSDDGRAGRAGRKPPSSMAAGGRGLKAGSAGASAPAARSDRQPTEVVRALPPKVPRGGSVSQGTSGSEGAAAAAGRKRRRSPSSPSGPQPMPAGSGLHSAGRVRPEQHAQRPDQHQPEAGVPARGKKRGPKWDAGYEQGKREGISLMGRRASRGAPGVKLSMGAQRRFCAKRFRIQARSRDRTGVEQAMVEALMGEWGRLRGSVEEGGERTGGAPLAQTHMEARGRVAARRAGAEMPAVHADGT